MSPKISDLSDGGTVQASDQLVVARAGANYKITGASLPTVVAGGMVEIYKNTLASTAASFDITSIPGTYRDLLLVASLTPVASGTPDINIRFNGDSGSNYEWVTGYLTGSIGGVNASTSDTRIKCDLMDTTNRFLIQTRIFDYADGAIHKYVEGQGTRIGGSVHPQAARWKSNSAITQITLSPSSGSWAVGSRVTLYGLNADIGTSAGTVTVTQTSHGLAVGDIVRVSGSNTYTKAKADSAANAEVVGIVTAVSDANNFALNSTGRITGLSGLTAGATYFLSPTTAGATTTSEPGVAGQVSKPVYVAASTTTAYFLNSRGYIVSGNPETIIQSTHGFVTGDVVRHNGSAFAKAQANNTTNAEVIGMVSSTPSADTFTLKSWGVMTGLSGLTAGAVYFLSGTTAGAITTTEPSSIGYVSKPVMIATSSTTGYFLNMRGSLISAAEADTDLLLYMIAR